MSSVSLSRHRAEAGTYQILEGRWLGNSNLLAGLLEPHGAGEADPREEPVTAMAVPPQDSDGFFLREARVLHTLHNRPHPGFPRLRDTVETSDGHSYVIMDQVGPDLNTYLKSRFVPGGPQGLPEDEAKVLLRQLASAVAHCHRNNIVLRDMKMGKTFFTDQTCSTLVIADVKNGEIVGSDGMLRDQVGTPAYVSPEVLSCKPYDGRAADIWTLGVMLFRLLTATYPFLDSEPAKLYDKILRASSAVSFPASSMSVGAEQLIRRLLDLDPRARPTADELLEEPWLCDVPRGGPGSRFLRRRASSASMSGSASPMRDPATGRATPGLGSLAGAGDTSDQVVPAVVLPQPAAPAPGAKKRAGEPETASRAPKRSNSAGSASS